MPTPQELEGKFWDALSGDRTMMLGLHAADEGHTRPMTAMLDDKRPEGAGDGKVERCVAPAPGHRKPAPAPAASDDPQQSISDGWRAAHRRFHQALIAGCPNHRLRGIASSLRDAAELYRHRSRRPAYPPRDYDREHGAITVRRGKLEVAQVVAVERNAAGGGIVKAADQVRQCGLTSS